MIGEWIRFGVTALCVVGGLFALLTALLGLFRFDYALNRLHAAAIADIDFPFAVKFLFGFFDYG